MSKADSIGVSSKARIFSAKSMTEANNNDSRPNGGMDGSGDPHRMASYGIMQSNPTMKKNTRTSRFEGYENMDSIDGYESNTRLI